MPHPVVSVVIPCYRQSHFLPEALESVFAQTYPGVEVIVVNDGSDDDTEAVAKRYGDRVRYLYQENGGLSSARNAGIRVAAGEWIQLLDADDMLTPEKIALQVAAVADRPEVDIIYSGYWCFGPSRPGRHWTYSTVEFSKNPFTAFVMDWERGLSIPSHAFLIHKSCFERGGFFDTSLPNHKDWDRQIRFAAAGMKYLYVPGQTALYRTTRDSMSRGPGAQAKMRWGKLACLEKFLTSGGMLAWQRQVVTERYVQDRAEEVLDALRAGQVRHAASLLCQVAVADRPIRTPLTSAWVRLMAIFVSEVGSAAFRRGWRLLKLGLAALL